MNSNPKVFISYTHDNDEHMEKVLALSNKLRADGIDTILDQYEYSPEEGWPKWMDKNISDADFVLVICTKTYFQRIMDKEKAGVGLGAKRESTLIYQYIYNSDSKSSKFIPVIFNNNDINHIPVPLQGKTHYTVSEETKYDKLYWFLRGIENSKPELGKLRPLPEKEKRSIFIGGFINLELWDKAKWNGTAFSHDKDLKQPPELCILFTEKEPATEIMKGRLSRLGEIDEYNELRISIIEGKIEGEDGYTVHINSNIENVLKRAKKDGFDIPEDLFMMISRLNRMNPAPGSTNLSFFKERYKTFGSYLIKVGVRKGDSIEILNNLYLHKREIDFRHVEDIKDKDDLDSVILPKYTSN